jgi:hypothetical protein
MAADPSGSEEVTPAIPGTGVKGDFIGAMIALKGGFQAGDCDPVFLFSVSLGILDLPDYAGVHRHFPKT